MESQMWTNWQSAHLYLHHRNEQESSRFGIDVLHPVRLFCKDVDSHFPVPFIPSFCCTRVNDPLDVGLDIHLLSILIMQGNSAVAQRIEDITNIRPASDAYAQIPDLCFDKLLYEA